MNDFIEMIATRYPDAAREIVETSSEIRAAFINGDKISSEDKAIIRAMQRRLCHQIASDVNPDTDSPEYDKADTIVHMGIAGYALPIGLRHKTISDRAFARYSEKVRQA